MTVQSTAEPAIRVQGLEKSYKTLHVLRGVEFEVARGRVFALLGSNGAGKTTTVRILATLLKADAGTVSVNGFDVATQAVDVRASRLTAYWPHLATRTRTAATATTSG
jgi:ABC-2 type transport system ATP-binding protein